FDEWKGRRATMRQAAAKDAIKESSVNASPDFEADWYAPEDAQAAYKKIMDGPVLQRQEIRRNIIRKLRTSFKPPVLPGSSKYRFGPEIRVSTLTLDGKNYSVEAGVENGIRRSNILDLSVN